MTSCDSGDCTTRTTCPCGLAPARPLNVTLTITPTEIEAVNHDTGEIRVYNVPSFKRPFEKLGRDLAEWSTRV